MSGKGGLNDEEKIYGGVMDKCLKDTAIKTGSGVGLGALASFLFTKGRKWPMIFGAGIGLGLSASACQGGLQTVNFSPRLDKTYTIPEFQKDPKYQPFPIEDCDPCKPKFDDCEKPEDNDPCKPQFDDCGAEIDTRDDGGCNGSSMMAPIIDVVATNDVITSDVIIETSSSCDVTTPALIVSEAVVDDVCTLPQIVMTSSDEIAAEIPSSPDE